MEHLIKCNNNKFYMGESLDKLYAEIDFEIDDKNRIVVTHTYVNPDYRGQGLANLLLNEVIKLAEASKQYIIPECSFAHKVLTSFPKYKHLLDPNEPDQGGGSCSWRA